MSDQSHPQILPATWRRKLLLQGRAAAMEKRGDRLRRFLDGNEHEVPLTLLNSIRTFMLPQIKLAGEKRLDGLTFLGTHSIMQIVGKNIFGISGLEATRFYLKNFVDDHRPDLRFSSIADLLHRIRNAHAHQWFSSSGHRHAIDYRRHLGFWAGADGIHINPSIFVRSFIARFPGDRPESDYRRLVSRESLISRKYEFISELLDVPRGDSVRVDLLRLRKLTGSQFHALAARVHAKLAVKVERVAS